nr:unnamed protein product [Digitaria exilis]
MDLCAAAEGAEVGRGVDLAGMEYLRIPWFGSRLIIAIATINRDPNIYKLLPGYLQNSPDLVYRHSRPLGSSCPARPPPLPSSPPRRRGPVPLFSRSRRSNNYVTSHPQGGQEGRRPTRFSASGWRPAPQLCSIDDDPGLQGKVRLTKWYTPYPQKQRSKDSNTISAFTEKVIKEISTLVLSRGPKLCNFVDWQGYRVVYKRYASLYFCMCIDPADNELETLQIIHHYVEILDRYFGNVCELDLIFNFHKAYFILDEVLIAGELQESNKKAVLRLVTTQDALVEAAKEEASSLRNIIAQATK